MTLQRPSLYVPPVTTARTSPWVEALKNLVVAIVAIVLVASAGLLFLFCLLLRRLWLPIERLVATIVYSIIGIVMLMVEKAVGLLITGALIGGVVYLVMEANPQIQEKINRVAAGAQHTLHNLTGWDIPELRIPGLREVMDMLTRQGSGSNPNPLHPATIEAQMRELKRVQDINLNNLLPQVSLPQLTLPNVSLPQIPHAAELQDVVGKKFVPKELQPLMGVTMQPEVLAQFKVLAESGALQKGAETALPLLQYGLYSRDAALSTASVEALSNMNTPQSRKMLGDYQKLISQVMNDAAHTRH